MSDRTPNGYCKHLKKLRDEKCADCTHEIAEAARANAKSYDDVEAGPYSISELFKRLND